MTDHQAMLKSCGMVYANGKYTADKFEARCGVNPRAFPIFFDVRPNDIVLCKPELDRQAELHFANVRANWQAIGV